MGQESKHEFIRNCAYNPVQIANPPNRGHRQLCSSMSEVFYGAEWAMSHQFHSSLTQGDEDCPFLSRAEPILVQSASLLC